MCINCLQSIAIAASLLARYLLHQVSESGEAVLAHASVSFTSLVANLLLLPAVVVMDKGDQNTLVSVLVYSGGGHPGHTATECTALDLDNWVVGALFGCHHYHQLDRP